MAKINSATITANESGNWTSEAVALTGGNKRVYLRVDGVQQSYRDFSVNAQIGSPSAGATVTSPVTVTGTGIPSSTVEVWDTPNSDVSFLSSWANTANSPATYCEVSSIGTTATAQGLLVVAWAGQNIDIALTSVAVMSGSGSIGAWTQRTNDTTGSGDGSVEIWTAAFTGTIANVVIRATSPSGMNMGVSVMAFDNVSASSPTGVVYQPAYSYNLTSVPDFAFTGCTAGSMVVRAGWTQPGSGSFVSNGYTSQVVWLNNAVVVDRSTNALTGTSITLGGGTGRLSTDLTQCGIEIKGA
jgi:hypothetical protein